MTLGKGRAEKRNISGGGSRAWKNNKALKKVTYWVIFHLPVETRN